MSLFGAVGFGGDANVSIKNNTAGYAIGAIIISEHSAEIVCDGAPPLLKAAFDTFSLHCFASE
jgi:hypothetical protein